MRLLTLAAAVAVCGLPAAAARAENPLNKVMRGVGFGWSDGIHATPRPRPDRRHLDGWRSPLPRHSESLGTVSGDHFGPGAVHHGGPVVIDRSPWGSSGGEDEVIQAPAPGGAGPSARPLPPPPAPTIKPSQAFQPEPAALSPESREPGGLELPSSSTGSPPSPSSPGPPQRLPRIAPPPPPSGGAGGAALQETRQPFYGRWGR